MKTRLAIWTHGGIGGGYYSQGQPCIQELVKGLSEEYEIDVYSLFPTNDEYKTDRFRIFSLNRKIESRALRWSYLVLKFIREFFLARYKVLYSFWGYPCGPVVVALSKISGCKSIIHLQGGDSVCLPEINYGVFCSPLKKRMCLWAYANTSVLICLTNFQKDHLVKRGVTREILVIPYGPDTNSFKFANDKFQGSVVRFIHIGNHTPVKHQKVLLDVFTKFKARQNGHLKIIGYDALKGELKDYARQSGLGDEVEFIEPVPHHMIPSHFSEADVILQTSAYEGQGMAVAEAASCGVLLAGTRVGLLSDLGEEYAIISEVGNSSELAEKIIIALQQKEQIQNCIEKSRQWIQAHNAEWTLGRIKSELHKLEDA